ncbi:molybdate ABC transporter substrate-binding protein [Bacillus sp. AFS015802]|uniref:molybdate ABC transporter substrate-binding protein n=1 Tax=Bacillus sp. AFS015802 TaxID=2033486 RepID=UPI0015CF1584|nr:molybdate ABC transporter substrate-binding protein [Bacillus sp. AFS015802]
MRKRIWIVIFIILLVTGCAPKDRDKVTLTISAAASLKDSMMEVKKEFEKQHPAIHIVFNFGGTGALRKQVEQGAPSDVFLSASKKDYERLVDRGLIDSSLGGAFLSNRLVIIAPESSNDPSLDALSHSGDKLAIGNPAFVPAGNYAKQALMGMGKWDMVKDQLVMAKDVRGVLTLVENQSVSLGIVYASDLTASEKVEPIQDINPSLHSKIGYYAGVLKKSKHPKEAALFYKFVISDKRKETFEKFGFTKG